MFIIAQYTYDVQTFGTTGALLPMLLFTNCSCSMSIFTALALVEVNTATKMMSSQLSSVTHQLTAAGPGLPALRCVADNNAASSRDCQVVRDMAVSRKEASERARQGLLVLGKQLLHDNKESGSTKQEIMGNDQLGSLKNIEAQCIQAARHYLSALPAEGLRLGLLQLVLDDCHTLRICRQRAYAVAAMASLSTSSPYSQSGSDNGLDRQRQYSDQLSRLPRTPHQDPCTPTSLPSPKSSQSSFQGHELQLMSAESGQELLLGLIDLSSRSSTVLLPSSIYTADDMRMNEIPLLVEEYKVLVAAHAS
jgi:hypothetical protein